MQHCYRMQVFNEDVDSVGIVHHASLICFMERARLMWLWDLGFRLDTLSAQGIYFVIKKITVDYVAPAKLYDELEIISEIIATTRLSKTYQQTIYSSQRVRQYCQAIIEVVCVNSRLRPCAMPTELIRGLV